MLLRSTGTTVPELAALVIAMAEQVPKQPAYKEDVPPTYAEPLVLPEVITSQKLLVTVPDCLPTKPPTAAPNVEVTEPVL